MTKSLPPLWCLPADLGTGDICIHLHQLSTLVNDSLVRWVLYSEVVIYDHASVPLLCRGLKPAERQPEKQHTRGLQSQLTRMSFIIIQQFFLT